MSIGLGPTMCLGRQENVQVTFCIKAMTKPFPQSRLCLLCILCPDRIEAWQPFVQRQLKQRQACIKRLLRHGTVKPDRPKVRMVCIGDEQHTHVARVHHACVRYPEERFARRRLVAPCGGSR